MQHLTSEQIQFFNDHGYLSLNALADPAEIPKIRTTIERLFEERAGETEGAYGELIARADEGAEANSPQILNPVNYAPQLHKTRCFQDALHIAKQLLGDEARFFLDLSILKKPKTGVGTPWHQDAAFRDPRFEYKQVSIWVPLQDVEVKSGCLQFVPDSHKNQVLQHGNVNDDPTLQALHCTDSFDRAAAVACPLPAGGCTIHHPRTLHCAGPNLSNVRRLAYIMTFGIEPTPAKEYREFTWLDDRETPIQARKRRWMRRGGVFITAWRRIRRGDVTSWQSTVYWLKRFSRTFRRGA
jgi:ectoine hydroxylase-related dioxygenase (phytanoyl-CoA dioxygenase family)